MTTRQYIGARYVPKFADPVEWSANRAYEALTIVTYFGNSYTSKIPVPPSVGNPQDNEKYWASTGNYNQQIDEYLKITNEAVTELKNLRYYTSPEAYDGSDYEKITQAINSGMPVIGKGEYTIDHPIVISKKNNITYDFSCAKITYTGNESAILITNSSYITLKLGVLKANNGKGVELKSTYYSADSILNDYVQYVNIDFVEIDALCAIYGNITGGWVNEIRVKNGQFGGGLDNSIGCHIFNNKDGITDGWYFENIGIEGVTTGFRFEAPQGRNNGIFIAGCRYAESYTTFLETIGRNEHISIIGSFPVYSKGEFFKLSSETSKSSVYCYDEDNRCVNSYIENGVVTPMQCVKNIITDLNDIKSNSFYVFDQASAVSNAPYAGIKNGFVATFYNEQIGFQIVSDESSKQVWTRYLWYGSFTPWKHLVYEDVLNPITTQTLTINYTKGTPINFHNVSNATLHSVINAFVIDYSKGALVKLYSYNSVLFGTLTDTDGNELESGNYTVELSYWS